MTKFAVTHPGKMGDMLYILPTIRYLYSATGLKSDVWTSDYCEPLRSLFEYQECVDKFIIAPNYKVERMDMGCQPWFIPVKGNYARVYQLGFRSVPDTMLHQFMAAKYANIHVPLEIKYDVPKWCYKGQMPEPYIVLAPRGKSTFEHVFNALADMTNAVIVGGNGDYTGHGYDFTGKDFLETASIISGARAFVGLMSSQLVLANGFDIPRVALNGFQADMRHSIIYHRNIYMPPHASASDVLAAIEQNLTA